VTGDRYAGAWVSEAFQKEGVQYKASELNKSELYLEALPYITSGAVELLDSRELIKELRLLERRRGSSGKDTVDHPKSMGGGVPHDDSSNVTCGLIAVAHSLSGRPGILDFYKKQVEEKPEVKEEAPKVTPTGWKRLAGDEDEKKRKIDRWTKFWERRPL
jgi:hypothetical protein